MTFTLRILSAALLTVGLASCGSGDGSKPSNPTGISSVRVFGDSIADSGTFGFKFTVNNAGPNGTATPIWTELVASTLGLSTVCPFFNIGAGGVATSASCKSYAVGGGRINNTTNGTPAQAGNATPWSIPYQMDVAASTVAGVFPANELIMLDGGGNDSADVIGAYLGAGSGAAGVAAYMTMLGQGGLLPAATINSTIGTANGAEKLGGMYMTALANKMADDINTKLLAKGASKVALVNAPAVTNTPRFKSVLKSVTASVTAQATAGGKTPAEAAAIGAAAASNVELLSRSWTQAFNDTLKTRFAAETRVAIVDLFTEFDNQVNTPAQFGLSNPISTVTGVTDTACPITGLDSVGLPNYNFVTCTAANLDAIAAKKDIWRTQSFSDGFHPTPYGHVLASQLLNRVLATKGWL